MSNVTLDQIIDELDTAHQRATYGAVAAVVNSSPRVLMSGRERNQRHSWVVSLKNGLPTEYPEELMHPALTSNATILKTRDELADWLSARGVQVMAEAAAV